MGLFDRPTRIIHISNKYVQPLCKPLFFPRFVTTIVDMILIYMLATWLINKDNELKDFVISGSYEENFLHYENRSKYHEIQMISLMLLFPGHLLKLILFFFGSPWNIKLNWFTHILINSGNITLFTTTVTHIILRSITPEIADQHWFINIIA